jgi:hypothetical protein
MRGLILGLAVGLAVLLTAGEGGLTSSRADA